MSKRIAIRVRRNFADGGNELIDVVGDEAALAEVLEDAIVGERCRIIPGSCHIIPGSVMSAERKSTAKMG